MTRRILLPLAVLAAFLSGPSSGGAQNTLSTDQQIAAVQAKMDAAVARVKAIVNQPVTRLRRTPDMSVAVFSPGWFHEGAIKPDFATVDIRATQELLYSKYTYVSSDLNPGEAFIGNELEFNPMTKYFYTDRTIPKSRLTESEMLEVNAQYRIIAQCTQQLEQLKGGLGQFTIIAMIVAIGLVVGGLYVVLPVIRKSA